MLILSLALLAAAPGPGGPATVEQTPTLFCSRALQVAGGAKRAEAVAEVGRDHRPLHRTLEVQGRDYLALWRFSGARFDSRRALERLELRRIALPRGTLFPVVAEVRFDGRTVLRSQVAQATSDMIRVPADGGPLPEPLPGISVRSAAGAVPTLFGVRHAELVVTAADGSQAARRTLDLPDWERLRGEAGGAFAAIERERRTGGCQPHSITSTS